MLKVTLDRWAELNFDPPPKLSTIRKWAREGFIFPPAIKHGRSYYVEADAQYLKPGSLAHRIAVDRRAVAKRGK